MSARDALTAAIIAAPDDDLPRLVFADFLEESGDDAYARFIRGQVERARTPAWEPFAVRWDRGLIPGADPNLFRDRLPAVVDDWNVEWDLAGPFRRGFGSAVRVRTLHTFLDTAPRLFDAAPVCELALPTATLDEWRRFAVQPWLSRVRVVRFAGLSTPIEPIRCLCESPFATGLEEIYFDRANSPAMPELVTALANSPLREQLRGLHYRVGSESAMDLIWAFGHERWPQLARLSFVTMGVSHVVLIAMRDAGILDQLVELNLSDNPQDDYLFDVICDSQLPNHLTSLTARRLTYEVISRPPVSFDRVFRHARHLDMSETTGLDADEITHIGHWFPGLMSLALSHTNPGDNSLDRLLEGPIWPQLVDIDLSQNTFSRSGLERLLSANVPQNLAWIGLPDCQRDGDLAEALHRKFAGRITPLS